MHIHAAARRGDWESLCYALGRGVSINARDTLEHTPLHCALSGVAALKRNPKSRLGFVSSMLEQGADLTAADHLGHQPLQAAASITCA
jgi:ankyrin repeat protein